jgi:hypothetical protein
MSLRTIGLAFVAGVAAFLLVGVAVTELLAARIEFSLFVGIPAGIVAGAVVTALVALGVGRDDAGARRIAVAAGTFGAAFLVTTVAVAVLVGIGVVLSMAAGVVVGLVAALVGYLRGPGGRSGTPV